MEEIYPPITTPDENVEHRNPRFRPVFVDGER